MAQITVTNETSGVIPHAPFRRMAVAVLGQDYKLNLIFVTSANIKKLNLIYRDKDVPTDILSFPLSHNEGEIYICPSEARIEAKKFDRTYSNFISFLFIHGCVHLKGYDHGGTMESIESKIRAKFKV